MTDIDFNGEEAIQSSLWEGWRKNTQTNLNRFGEDYLTWVSELPMDIHRGRALQTLGHEAKATHPHLAERAIALMAEQRKELSK